MKRNLLIKDKDYEQVLDEMGFCMVPIFSIEQVNKIKELYQQFSIDTNVAGLIASHSKIGPEKNLHVSNSLREIVMPALQNWFGDFDFFMGGFMVKEAHTSKELPLHQDWNILDESLYTSYQIWIPVELSYPGNGGMYVLPRSHRFFNNFRSGSYDIPTIDTDDTLRPHTVDMIIPPGSALVFPNSLFHASYPNVSSQNRISAIISIYQKNAPLTYCHKNTLENCTDIYGINSTLFLTELNTLEDGGVPSQPLNKTKAPINEIDNKRITASTLFEMSSLYFKDDETGTAQFHLHILKDREIEKKIQQDGYVILDFIDNTLVSELKSEYEKSFQEKTTETGRFSTLENTNPQINKYYHNYILEKIAPSLRKHFINYRIPIASYFTKYANSRGDLDWHNDSSLLLNSHLEPHLAVWCPLVDVDEKNGALCVIEKSHKSNKMIILYDLPWPHIESLDLFEKNKKVLNLRAGQCVIFDIRLIHNATPNQTDNDRICFTFRITHEKSAYYNFRCENGNKKAISVFEESNDCYLRDNSNSEGMINKKIGEILSPNAHIDIKN
jgi:ectoine hydroxylase-related dioxygenase (phytanoyl-CoA dioxygenase family)